MGKRGQDVMEIGVSGMSRPQFLVSRFVDGVSELRVSFVGARTSVCEIDERLGRMIDGSCLGQNVRGFGNSDMVTRSVSSFSVPPSSLDVGAKMSKCF